MNIQSDDNLTLVTFSCTGLQHFPSPLLRPVFYMPDLIKAGSTSFISNYVKIPDEN